MVEPGGMMTVLVSWDKFTNLRVSRSDIGVVPPRVLEQHGECGASS
jgi:hypothetical protein